MAATQVNFTLDPHWRLVLRLAAEADGLSVPDLLRPVVLRYLKGRLRDEDLAEAVARMERSRRTRRRVPDNVAAIPRKPRASHRKPKQQPGQPSSR